MPKGINVFRIQQILLSKFSEKLIQLFWYMFWIILLIRQKTRPAVR